MAKAKTLTELLKAQPDGRKRGKRDWRERLQEKHPDFYAEMLALIRKHYDGDAEVLRKLPTETACCEWLEPIVHSYGEHVSANTIGGLFRELKRSRNGKS